MSLSADDLKNIRDRLGVSEESSLTDEERAQIKELKEDWFCPLTQATVYIDTARLRVFDVPFESVLTVIPEEDGTYREIVDPEKLQRLYSKIIPEQTPTEFSIEKYYYDQHAIRTSLHVAKDLKLEGDAAKYTPFIQGSPMTRRVVESIQPVEPLAVAQKFVDIFIKPYEEPLTQKDKQFIYDWIAADGPIDGSIGGENLLFIAIARRRPELFHAILTVGLKTEILNISELPECKENMGMTLVCRASANAQNESIELLIAKGANLDQVSVCDDSSAKSYGWFPLLLAVENKHHRTVDLLLNGGADPNVKAQVQAYKGITPLALAIAKGDLELVKILLADPKDGKRKAADPNMLFDYGEYYSGISPLFLAQLFDKKEIFEELVNHGATKPEAREDMSSTDANDLTERVLDIVSFARDMFAPDSKVRRALGVTDDKDSGSSSSAAFSRDTGR